MAPGAAGDGGLVVVPEGTAPPDFAVGGGRHLLGRETAVLLRMPLAGDLRELAGEVVEPGQDLPPAAHGAAVAAVAAGDGGLPFVPVGATPPDLAAAARGDVAGREGAVLRRMPFGGEGGIARGEVVLAREHLLARTDGTTGALDARFDLGLPGVAALAAPPDLGVAGGGEVRGTALPILRRVPLAREGRLGGGEVVEPGQHLAAAADGAAGAGGGAFLDAGLPMMAAGAGPPDLGLAAIAHVCWGQRRIGSGVPLAEQVVTPGALAVSCKGFAHAITSQKKNANRINILLALKEMADDILLRDRHSILRKNIFSRNESGPSIIV